MDSSVIYAIGYLVIGTPLFYNWKKYKTKEFLWLTWFSGVGCFIESVHYCLIIFGASQNILSAARTFVQVFDLVLLIAMTFIAIRYYTRK